jgi:crotonobetainyl-CoA:carnitine CoA-transferase CaiB-like acyl-CoA transferase
MGPLPALGEHTGAVLAELGYDAAAIARLAPDQPAAARRQ